MNEIKCPQCGKIFKIDESGFADIIKQVRDQEFEKAINEREILLEADKEKAVQLAEANTKLAIAEALAKIEKERDNLAAELTKKDVAAKLAEANIKNSLQTEVVKKDSEITELKAKIQAHDTEKKLSITEAVNKVEKERDSLANELKSKDAERQLLEATLKDKHTAELKTKDEMIAYYKDMKARLSTKMVGETLEQHCQIQFNQIRATAFPTAYFDKDDDVKTGSKGDYIYRESDDEGNEIISIMFEMKNERDETATKKKNEDFLKELDKDRREKGCKYTVLVTMLEAENELYNSGIVDISYRFPKMYVIRPQL